MLKPVTKKHIVLFYLYKMSSKGQYKEAESRLVVTRSWEREEQGVTAIGYQFSFWGAENIQKLDSGDGFTSL